MNWDAIGAIAEGVGAIAVVVTLAYMAVQMRTANKRMNWNHSDSLMSGLIIFVSPSLSPSKRHQLSIVVANHYPVLMKTSG
jgi:hypothetical protein